MIIQQKQIEDEFSDVFVMVKVLEFDVNTKLNSPTFYTDIVKYTNKQNAINENAFGAKQKVFENLQNEFMERGFLLLRKPSDKNTFSTDYSTDQKLNSLLTKANRYATKVGLNFSRISDISIPLDKLLQVCLAFFRDGSYAYTKKDVLLKPTSEIYNDFSITISQLLQTDNLIRLYLIYVKAEKKRSESDDKRTPIPYYLIGFLGSFIKNEQKRNSFLKDLYESKNDQFIPLFDYLEKLTNRYKKTYLTTHKSEYNSMIKKPIDNKVLNSQIDNLNDLILTPGLESIFTSLT